MSEPSLECVSDYKFSLKYWILDKWFHFKWGLKWYICNLIGAVPCKRDGNLVSHAKREMEIAWPDSDDMQSEMKKCILDIIGVFSAQGHSGSSAAYLINEIKDLMSFKPITPLTGDESEWSEPFDMEGTRQNVRYSAVFMRKDGTAYNIDGKVFVEPSGCGYTSKGSMVEVTFPYVPKTEYVQVEFDAKETS